MLLLGAIAMLALKTAVAANVLPAAAQYCWCSYHWHTNVQRPALELLLAIAGIQYMH
jgi:hypothetical protein